MAIKQKQNNLFDDYMDRRFQEMAWAEARNESEDRQPVTVRLPISLVRKIDFLAKNLEHSRQVFLDDLIGLAVAQALNAYVAAHAEGEHRDRAHAEVAELYRSASREEAEAVFGALEEAK
ncbi:TPA: hypothetical protein L4847_007142 [Pseudomonas aeruginosa]|nr:hypothetical protein [Pseudomonas aeruginosa]HBO7139346.1 hypothetical protein [Pseudomonas aeruginosa]HBO7312399.1 hypothetical protein [Pseudomonas aeruginosa]HBO7339710.1 hypothetical protein [Pseudomonas aeruginosa]HBO7402249.1 hypothetical protein [Pseudomonas aeruginosa]